MTWLPNIPNIKYLAPTSEEELVTMMDWALSQKTNPVVIHLPEHGLENRPANIVNFDQAKYDMKRVGEKVALLALGGLYSHGEKVAHHLEQSGIKASLINPLFVNELDEEMLKSLADSHDVIVTLEDGILDGGFGQKVASFVGKYDVKVLNYGAKREFNDEVPVAELYDRYHLTPELMVKDIMELLS